MPDTVISAEFQRALLEFAATHAAPGDPPLTPKGKVVARGTHADLVTQEGAYKDLYSSQIDLDAVRKGAS